MAKRETLDPEKEAEHYKNKANQTQPTQEAPAFEEPPEKDKVESYGVGLRKSEWQRYDEIAAEMQMTKHGVALFALRYFLKQYDAGEVETGTKPTFKL